MESKRLNESFYSIWVYDKESKPKGTQLNGQPLTWENRAIKKLTVSAVDRTEAYTKLRNKYPKPRYVFDYNGVVG